MEQPGSQVLLEVRDHPRERRRRNSQPVRRGHEAPGLDDADERFHGGQSIHRTIIPFFGTTICSNVYLSR
jgi:hypothetical protein